MECKLNSFKLNRKLTFSPDPTSARKVQKLLESFGFRVNLYAEDTQFHDSCKSTHAAELAAPAMRVIEAVRDWMSPNRFRLNANYTQFICLGTSHFLGVLQINSIPANKGCQQRGTGVYFDPGLLMERQVNKLCQVCYFHRRCLKTVRLSLTKESLLTLVHAFVTSRVDHCNMMSSTGQVDIFSTAFSLS